MADKLLKIAVVLTAIDKMSEVIGRSVVSSENKLKKFQHGLNTFGNYALIAGAAGVEFFHKTIEDAEQSEKAAHIAERVWKNMGDSTGEAFKKAHEFAEQLSTKIGIVHEKIEAAESALSIYGKVSDDTARRTGVFQDTVMTAFNAQALGFGDAESNIKKFGLALQDPDKYLKRLARTGITFGDQQVKQIKMLEKTGHLHQAQMIILKALKSRFGDVAKSGVTSAEELHVKWHEVKVKIGEQLLPVWNMLAHKLMDVVKWVTKFTDEHPKLVKWLALGAAGLLALGVAAKIVAFSINGLSTAWKVLQVVMSPSFFLMAAIAATAYLIIDNWDGIIDFFKKVWNNVWGSVKNAWNWITGKIGDAYNWVVDKWHGISRFFTGLWDGIKNVSSSIWDSVVNAITHPIQWIMDKWEKLKNWFKKLFEDISNWSHKLFDSAANTGDANIERIRESFKKHMAASKAIEKAFGNSAVQKVITNHILTKAAPGLVIPSPAPIPIRSAGGGTTILNYSPTLHYTGDNKDDFKKMLDDHAQHIVKITDEVNRKRNRTKF